MLATVKGTVVWKRKSHVLISLVGFFIIHLLKALFNCFRSTNSEHSETEWGPELERSCKIITQRRYSPPERRHTNTTTKTWVAYGNTHLACEVHKLHQSTLYLLPGEVTIGDSGLCCCVCVTALVLKFDKPQFFRASKCVRIRTPPPNPPKIVFSFPRQSVYRPGPMYEEQIALIEFIFWTLTTQKQQQQTKTKSKNKEPACVSRK